jgi:imidazolonepropionase-like amidohydrolase
MSEVDYLHKYGFLNSEQILDIITRVNPQMILPNRKIGEIKDGYEASFLVLEKNPLTDMQSVKKIDFRVKKGVILN